MIDIGLIILMLIFLGISFYVYRSNDDLLDKITGDKENIIQANQELKMKMEELKMKMEEQSKPKEDTDIYITPALYSPIWEPPYYGWYNSYSGGRRHHHKRRR